MTKRYYFIINPEAGKGKKLHLVPDIQAFCRKHHLTYETVITKRPGEATELARQAVAEYDVIVAVGGDGTVNEVINGIIGTPALLGIIPTGSGNDYATQLGIGRSVRSNLNVLLKGRIRKTDVGELVGDRYFINALGIGFDGEVASRVRQFLGVSRGFFAYLLAVLRTLATYRFRPVRIELDNHVVFEKKILLAATCNGTTYGGGFKVAPSAKIDNGIFTVCVVDKVSRFGALRYIPKIMKGTHVTLPIVHTYTSNRVMVTSDYPHIAQADGEVLAPRKRFEMVMHPHAVSVLTPN